MPASPRTRPAKAALGRDAVVDAALAVVDEVGLQSASMRRVAQALDTGPASLYVYVADRDELMVLAHDRALDAVAIPTDADGDWRARLEALVDRCVDALAAHADLAAVAFATIPFGPNMLRVNEEMLRLLRTGGVDDASCAWAPDLLGQYIASSAVEFGSWRRGDVPTDEDPTASIDDVYAALSDAEFPTIASLRGRLTGGGGDARAAWKLRVIVDGLLAQSVPTSPVRSG